MDNARLNTLGKKKSKMLKSKPVFHSILEDDGILGLTPQKNMLYALMEMINPPAFQSMELNLKFDQKDDFFLLNFLKSDYSHQKNKELHKFPLFRSFDFSFETTVLLFSFLAVFFVHACNVAFTCQGQPVRIHGLGGTFDSCLKYILELSARSVKFFVI